MSMEEAIHFDKQKQKHLGMLTLKHYSKVKTHSNLKAKESSQTMPSICVNT